MNSRPHRTKRSKAATSTLAAPDRVAPPFPIVAIGASAGGLEAFSLLLGQLPIDSGLAFVLVQHLDPEHESALVQILRRSTELPVQEIRHDQPIAPNVVHVIPKDTALSIERGLLKLQPRAKTRIPHRPIDAFFESLAEHSKDQAIGVVLSGTGSDGTLGLEAIKAEGGITFAQDDSAKYGSMPQSAIAADCVDLVLSPAGIAQELARIARHPYIAKAASAMAPSTDESGGEAAILGAGLRGEKDRATATAHEDDATPLPSGGPAHEDRPAGKRPSRGVSRGSTEDGYGRILLLLRNHSGVDFSLYKSPTIQRRINRRLIITRHETLLDYAEFLQKNVQELDALYSDVLISVTSFFRNPEMFDVLKHTVLPAMLSRRGEDPLRCWVLGCSTGQEAYSIAMSFVEAAEHAPQLRKLQIFATDLNEALLEKARHGLYARSLAQDIDPERLRRFFVEEEGGYRVTKALREMVVFARQNLIADPPFSRMDLISCRNLLIYLEPALQNKAMPTFHYALRPGGFLLLGASESIGGFTELFEPVDKKHKIYSKKVSNTPTFRLPVPAAPGDRAKRGPRPTLVAPLAANLAASGELTAQREADRVTISQFAPPGVLVNAELQVLQFRGQTGAYLAPPAGKASFDVIKMARQGLVAPLRNAIEQAVRDRRPVRIEGARVESEGETRLVNIEVLPLTNLREPCLLILFEDARQAGRAVRPRAPPTPRLGKKQEQDRIVQLETELAEVRDYLQSILERHEAGTEDLQAAHEEVQSANEELQSVNEELETSKEELESANEELITVNDEMAHRNVELHRVNNDLVNFQASTHLAIVLVSRDLKVRLFSPKANALLDLRATDIGRPIGHLRHNLFEGPEQSQVAIDLEQLISETISTVRERELDVLDRNGCWHSLRVRPYLTSDNRVDGAVLVLVDIDARKRTEAVVASARAYAENTINTVREPLLVLDRELRVESANRAFYHEFKLSPRDAIGQSLFEFGHQRLDRPELRKQFEQMRLNGAVIQDFEFDQNPDAGESKSLMLNACRLVEPSQSSERYLLAFQDVTARKRTEQRILSLLAELEERDRHKDTFLAMLAHELRGPLAPLVGALDVLKRSEFDPGLFARVRDAMDRQLVQLVRLVDDLRDISRISRGKLELRRARADLNQILLQSLEACQALPEHAGHQLAVFLSDVPIRVHCDPARLAQVFSNLLTNAFKYTPPEGRVELRSTLEGGDAVVVVADSGIGIRPEMLPHVFDLFAQDERARDRAHGGLGIGLALARDLVEMHEGSIHVASEGDNRGATFVVRLPIARDD